MLLTADTGLRRMEIERRRVSKACDKIFAAIQLLRGERADRRLNP